MEQFENGRQRVPSASEQPAKAYRSPTLTAYGSVAKLTLGSGGSIVDTNQTMAMIQPPGQR